MTSAEGPAGARADVPESSADLSSPEREDQPASADVSASEAPPERRGGSARRRRPARRRRNAGASAAAPNVEAPSENQPAAEPVPAQTESRESAGEAGTDSAAPSEPEPAKAHSADD
jgi:hypothetical protein